MGRWFQQSNITSQDYGRLLYAAKMQGSPLLAPLLRARAATPIYRLRTAEGRPWRPAAATITTIETGITT